MPPTVPQAARTPHQVVGWRLKGVARHTRAARPRARALQADRVYSIERTSLVACTDTPTTLAGPCPLTAAGSLAAWMPPSGLQGRTCSVPRWWADKGPAAKLQIDRSSTSGSRSSALQWINAKSSYRDLSAQAEPQPKRGPRIRRIGPRTSGNCTVLPCWVTRMTPAHAAAAATARTCGIRLRHTAASSLNARATSEGQIDCSGCRCASKCRISAAICASSGGCTPAPGDHSGRRRRRPNQSLASFQPCVTLSPAAAARSAKRASVYLQLYSTCIASPSAKSTSLSPTCTRWARWLIRKVSMRPRSRAYTAW